jgi:hypothetical protein
MSYLQGRAIHVDKHLSQIAINYKPTGFIADQIFPLVMVEKQSDMIKTYNQGDLWRRDNTIRAPGTEANKVSIQVGSDSYICKNYALKAQVTIEDRANADPIFIRDLEEGRVIYVTDKIKIDWEARAAGIVTNPINVSTQSMVGSAWTDYVNSDPLGDIWERRDAIEDNTGYKPNRAAFSGTAWRNFSRNNSVIDKIYKTGVSGGAMPATESQAARLLEMDKVLVARSFYNAGEEGQDLSLSRIWGDNVLLYYVPDRPSREFPSYGYTFRWRGKGLPDMNVQRHPYDSRRHTDDLEVGFYQDEKIISIQLGALISDTSTSTP